MDARGLGVHRSLRGIWLSSCTPHCLELLVTGHTDAITTFHYLEESKGSAFICLPVVLCGGLSLVSDVPLLFFQLESLHWYLSLITQ